jgi:hypothetical protein
MAYGTLKCDNIVFDNGGVDKLLTVSGLFYSTSGALTVTGAISGGSVTAPTATFTTLTGTTTAGTTATFTSGSFTSLTGVTTTVTSGVFSSGIATAPSVAIGSGTTNKPGIYSPGTDQLAISTSGTGRLFVNAAGLIDISNTTSDKLTLSYPGFGIGTFGVDSTGSLLFKADEANTQANSLIQFKVDGTERLRIDSSGNLGLGGTTALTGSRLYVQQTGESYSGGQSSYNSLFPAGYIQVLDARNVPAGTVNSSLLVFSNTNSNGNTQAYIGSLSGNSDNAPAAIVFGQKTSSTVWSERMRIDTSGRLGLGTTGPSTTLDIVGNSRVLYGTSSTNTGDQNVLILGAVTTGVYASSYGAGLQFQINNSSGGYAGPRIVGRLNADNNTANLVFQARNYGFNDSMTLDASGNLGLGGAAANYVGYPNLRINGTSGGILDLSTNGTSVFRLTGDTTGAYYYTQNASYPHVWGAASSERMRLDGSGRLLVGTSNARTDIGSSQTASVQTESTINGLGYFTAYNQANAFGSVIALAKSRGTSVGSNTIVQSGDQIGGVYFYGADGVDTALAGSIDCYVDGTPGSNNMPGRLVFSTTPSGSASPTTKMQINNDGKSGVYSTNPDVFIASSSSAAGSANYLFRGAYSATAPLNGTVSFQVTTNGNVTNTNGSYTSISDQKLKENIVDASSQWKDVKAFRIRNWNFKEETGYETHRQISPIAQELEQVSPNLVFEILDRDENGKETGEVTKGINLSVLYMKAVKALQEAMERIETLEAKITALEGK